MNSLINSSTYSQASILFDDISRSILAQDNVILDPVCEPYSSFSDQSGSVQGSLSAWSGEVIDWLVSARFSSQQDNFHIFNLNAWLGPETIAPHAAFEFSIMDDCCLFYLDFHPRLDPLINAEYFDRYIAPLNDEVISLSCAEDFKPFHSASAFMRQSFSASCLCYQFLPDPKTLAKVKQLFEHRLSMWLGWLKESSPSVSEEQYQELCRRDEILRRNLIERDPGSAIARRILGADLAGSLQGVMTGRDRTLFNW